MPISGGRASSPALESMIERGRTFVSEQPRNLPERHPWIVQILGCEALPQFVDDVAVCRALFGQSSREGAHAEGQSRRHVFGFRFAVGQQLLHLGLNLRAESSRSYVPLLGSGIAVGSKDAEQLRIGGDQWKVESIPGFRSEAQRG